jgi:hypothetical protein
MFNAGSNLPMTKKKKKAWKNFAATAFKVANTSTSTTMRKMFNAGSNLRMVKEEKEAWKNFAATTFKVANTT